MADLPLLPAGIDLIEISKARSFYRRHVRRLGSFLSQNEIAYVHGQAGRPYERLAELLAAKEAVFKTHGGAWMGLSGFSGIEIRSTGKNLSYRYGRGYASRRGQIIVVRNKRFVVAMADSVCVGN